ncbi:hypothetical protein JCM11251_004305 [Rhodosporidiobolus azoricus]
MSYMLTGAAPQEDRLDKGMTALGLDAPTRKALRAAGVSSSNGSRILVGRREDTHRKLHLEAQQFYDGDDGYRHKRELDADLDKVHSDVKALFANPKAQQGKRLALLERHSDQLHGKLMYRDERLGKIPKTPPTTPEELAQRLLALQFGDEIKKVTLKLDIQTIFIKQVEVDAQVQPVLAVVTPNGLPDHNRILGDPSLNDDWRVRGVYPGQMLELEYLVSIKEKVRYTIVVHVQLEVDVELQ